MTYQVVELSIAAAAENGFLSITIRKEALPFIRRKPVKGI